MSNNFGAWIGLSKQSALQLFRLLGFDSLADSLGLEGSDRENMQYMAGMAMGRALIRRGTMPAGDVERLITEFDRFYQRLGMGVIHVHVHTDGRVVVAIGECAGCFGADPVGRPICFVEAGMICGLFAEASGATYDVSETKCIGGMGDQVCEFELIPR